MMVEKLMLKVAYPNITFFYREHLRGKEKIHKAGKPD